MASKSEKRRVVGVVVVYMRHATKPKLLLLASAWAGCCRVAVRSGSQYPSYRFYEPHLRGFDPCDGPMCIEPTCALAIAGTRGVNLKTRGAHANRIPRLGLDEPRPAHSEVGVDRGSYWRGGGLPDLTATQYPDGTYIKHHKSGQFSLFEGTKNGTKDAIEARMQL